MSRAAPKRPTLNYFLALSALGWPFVVGFFGGGLIWALPPHLGGGGEVRQFGVMLFFAGLGSGPVWYVCSKILKTPRRVVLYAVFRAVLVIPLFAATFGACGVGYFALIPQLPLVRMLQYLAIAFASVTWIGIDLHGLRKRVIAKRYMEREFIEFDDHVEMRWERKTDIEAPPISNATALGRVWNRHGLKLVLAIAPLSGAGYATSRLLEHAGGDEAVLLFLSVLGLPLCLYMLSKLVCGAYLNVYKVWQIERKTGKPVLFDEIPEA